MNDQNGRGLSPVDLSIEQRQIYERLIQALNSRHNRIHDTLAGVLSRLKAIGDAAGDPISDELYQAIQHLVIVAGEQRRLQDETSDILLSQLVRLVTAKRAYDRGWNDRLLDLLADATPDQVAILDALIIAQDEAM